MAAVACAQLPGSLRQWWWVLPNRRLTSSPEWSSQIMLRVRGGVVGLHEPWGRREHPLLVQPPRPPSDCLLVPSAHRTAWLLRLWNSMEAGVTSAANLPRERSRTRELLAAGRRAGRRRSSGGRRQALPGGSGGGGAGLASDGFPGAPDRSPTMLAGQGRSCWPRHTCRRPPGRCRWPPGPQPTACAARAGPEAPLPG